MSFVAWWFWMTTVALGSPLDVDRWGVVNDTVMGGVSTSQVVESRGALEFRGVLSLENNGGFTSARSRVDSDWSAYDHLKVRVRGDGRQYLMTVRVRDGRMRRIYYRTPIQTQANKEMEFRIPMAEFEAYAYGTRVPQAPRLLTQRSRIASIGVMLADKKPGPFALQILEVSPYSDPDAVSQAVPDRQAVAMALQLAIEQGVPLYNSGQPERCYDVYRTVLVDLLVLAPGRLTSGQQSMIQRALETARMQSNPNDQAWTLRTAMDALLMNQL